MHERIQNILAESIQLKQSFVQAHLDMITRAADMLTTCLASGHKVLIFGNGGSAADAQHIAAEFVNRFRVDRPPLAALALTTDTSVLTSISNDFSFEDIFAKQIQALGHKDDIAWGISTSGGSPNVIRAMQVARELGLFTMALTGAGGEVARHTDLVLAVPSPTTARIQEVHIFVGHILCELVERKLFPEPFRQRPAARPASSQHRPEDA
jgi:D-sedoheptulose 7-phosphate isomerase